MKPRCSRTNCRWVATHTVDTNQPPYAGPRLVCTEHMLDTCKGLPDGKGAHVVALPREDTTA